MYVMNICLALILLLFPESARSADDLAAAIEASKHGLYLQSKRLKVVSQNIANAGIPPTAPGITPYKRQIVSIKLEHDDIYDLELPHYDGIIYNNDPFEKKYDKFHPAADEDGIVLYPNVNLIIENADAKEIQRHFEANMHSMEITKTNQSRLLDMLN